MLHLSGSCLFTHVCDLRECIWLAGESSFWTRVCANSSMSSASALDYSSLSLWTVLTSLLHHSFLLLKRSGICNSNNVVREGFWSLVNTENFTGAEIKKTSFPAENLVAFVGICVAVKCICSSTTQKLHSFTASMWNLLILVIIFSCHPLLVGEHIPLMQETSMAMFKCTPVIQS